MPIKSQKKTTILFVLSQLVQHGSERYLFEICRALDKDRFAVEVLTRSFFVKKQFYYQKLIDLGIPVHRKLISRRHMRYAIKWIYNRNVVVQRLTRWFHQRLVKFVYGRFFEAYDVIAVVGIETYCDALSPLLDEYVNVVIHHVTHQYQFERNYFEECRQKRIVYGDKQQEIEIRRSRLHNAELYFLPLLMNFEARSNLSARCVDKRDHVRIGVVSRLYKDRPNEPLFRCFRALTKLLSDAELYFYGGGDSTQYNVLLSELGIGERVKFMGHQSDLESAVLRDQISILWQVSMGTSISYASIEIASLGCPMLFWNLSAMTYKEILAETEGALHSFSDEDQFASFNYRMLEMPDELLQLGSKLRYFVQRRFGVSYHIGALQQYYLSVAANEECTQERSSA